MFGTVKNQRCPSLVARKQDTCAGQELSGQLIKNLRITNKAILINLGYAGGSILWQIEKLTPPTAGFHQHMTRRTPLLRQGTKRLFDLYKSSHEQRNRLLYFYYSILFYGEMKKKIYYFGTLMDPLFGVK